MKMNTKKVWSILIPFVIGSIISMVVMSLPFFKENPQHQLWANAIVLIFTLACIVISYSLNNK